jgi:type IV secretion system protein VirD4
MSERIRIGYWDRTCTTPLWYPGAAHAALIAPTRAGKFRDVLCQTLLTYKGSCMVVDPKGQAAAVTARYRKDVLKQDVCVINPFGVFENDYLKDIRHAQYNPVQSNLKRNETLGADCDSMAEGLLPLGGPETHWIESARLLLSGIIAAYRMTYDNPNLVDVYRMIARPDIFEYCRGVLENPPGDFIAERLGRFGVSDASANREVRAIVSAAITGLGFIGNGPISRSLSDSTVDFGAMTERPMTVYLILPGIRLASCAKWFRLLVNSWAEANMREGKKKVPLLGVIDEYKDSVGTLNIIQTLMGMSAGYGIQLMPVLRNLVQLQELHPKSWESFLSDSGCTLVFPPRDWTTSDYFSRMVGMTEIQTVSRSAGDKPGVTFRVPHGPVDAFNQLLGGLDEGGDAQVNFNTQAKRELEPEAIREMPDSEMLVFAEGMKVIRAGRRPYYETDEFRGLYSPDPYHV